jgi:siroheme synthase (precorrin-2 oxidase/ferrochelatase)
LINVSDNQDIVTPAEQEYEKFKIEISTQKGSSIRVETSSYNKIDDLIDKALNTYTRLTSEESGQVEQQQQYQ